MKYRKGDSEMLVPEVFRRSIFDDFFENPFSIAPTNAMKTDVRESDKSFELMIDMPGIRKEDVKAELHNGYLTVSACTCNGNDETDNKGAYVRRERFRGTYSRSFYVGEGVTEQDIKAKFADGVLRLDVPKKDAQTVDTRKYIAIES